MPTPVRGDVVYLDPPYVGTFDGYTSDGFNNEQQDRLLTMASGWTADGVAVAYSNSGEAEERVRRLWPAANVEFFSTAYTVNRDPEGRKGKRELFAASRKEAPMSEVPAAPPATEFDIAISPSQVETFDLCARKWAYNKIDRIPSPQNAAAALGEAAHKHREDWLIHGIPPPDDKTGKLARVGMEHLPPPGKAMVEIPLVLPVTLAADPTVNGGRPVRVKVNGRIDFFVPNTPESGFVFGEAGIPLIGDHKTTSGEQWAKTADELLTKDSQAAIYAAYALHVVPTAPAVDLHWSYMVKGSSLRQHQVKTRISREQALTRFSAVVSRAKDMLRVIQTPGIVASAVEPTVASCEAFGGCPYREVCPISNQEKVGALMAQGSLNDLLTARLANPVAAPAAPAPTNHNALAGLLGGTPAATPATGPISNPSAMAALFGTPAPAAPAPAFVAPAPAFVAPALVTAPPAGGALAGLFGALGTPPPAPTAPVAAPNPMLSIMLGTTPVPTPVAAPAAPPAPVSAVSALLLGGGAPVASAPVVLAPVVLAPVVEAVAPAAPAMGVVPPDAPASDPTLTLEDVKAMQAGTKKRKTKKATGEEVASLPHGDVIGDAMVAVLTRIAVALEALAGKGG
jgi:hypothetical protein